MLGTDVVTRSGDRGFGVSCLLAALCFGFLALQDRLAHNREDNLSLFGERGARARSAPGGSPRTTVTIIVVLALLLIVGDVRFIASPKEPHDALVGVGQMLLWLPMFGYLAYREIRRMREEKGKR